MNNNFSKELGEWLTEKRKEAHLTQEQAGNLIGSGKQNICNWEKGIRNMSAKDLIEYCAAIHADLAEFVAMQKQ